MEFNKERASRDLFKFTFGNSVIDQWNKLPEEVKNGLDNYLRIKLI